MKEETQQEIKKLTIQIVDNLKGGSDEYLEYPEMVEAIESKIGQLVESQEEKIKELEDLISIKGDRLKIASEVIQQESEKIKALEELTERKDTLNNALLKLQKDSNELHSKQLQEIKRLNLKVKEGYNKGLEDGNSPYRPEVSWEEWAKENNITDL